MRAYKLLRIKKSGALTSLFINRKFEIPTGVWIDAEDHTTEGFKRRPYWHVLFKPYAPHLKMKLASGERRIWALVEVQGVTIIKRPENQGGSWGLAKRLKIIKTI